jgi:hypothetical protein
MPHHGRHRQKVSVVQVLAPALVTVVLVVKDVLSYWRLREVCMNCTSLKRAGIKKSLYYQAFITVLKFVTL